MPILAEWLDSKYWKTTNYFQTVYVVLVLTKYYELVLSSIGSGAAAFKTPPKQRIIKRIQAAGRNAAGAAVLVASLFVSTLLNLKLVAGVQCDNCVTRIGKHGTGFSEYRGFRARVPFFPLPHPHPSSYLLSPHFPRVPNAKTPSRSRGPILCSARTGMLATQAS